MPTTLRRALAGAALLAVLAGCGQEAAPAPAGPTPSADTAPHEGAEEVEELAPRVLVGHDGGFLVLDSASGEVLDDVPLAGVSGLSPSLDGRHVLVATPKPSLAEVKRVTREFIDWLGLHRHRPAA